MENLINEIKNLNNERHELDKKLRLNITEYLKGLPFDAYGTFEFNEDYGCVCVTYDGGIYPEYASVFAEVRGVAKDKYGDIGLILDEEGFYSLDRIGDIGEVSYLVEVIDETLKRKEETEVEGYQPFVLENDMWVRYPIIKRDEIFLTKQDCEDFMESEGYSICEINIKRGTWVAPIVLDAEGKQTNDKKED